MKKRMSLLFVIMLMAVTVLAACSGGGTAEQPPSQGEQTEQPPAEGNGTETTEPPAEGGDESQGYFEAADPSLNPAAALNRKDTLIVGMTAPKGVFSPFYWQTAYDKFVVEAMFDSFFSIQGDGTYANRLAESVEVSEDKLKYTFKLKPGVTYSNGDPVTVKDYAFAMKVYHDSSYDGQTDMLSVNIKGGKEYNEGKATDISGIKVIDDNTIEIEVTEANAMTKDNLGTVSFVPESYYGKGYKQGNLEYMKELHAKPIGSGQYVLKSFSPGQEVVLEANPNYFLGAPKIKNVIYKTTTEETRLAMFQSGEIDMDMVTVNEDNVEALKEMGFLDINIFPTNGYGYVAMNHKDPKFQDPKVRQALIYGLNRAEVVEIIYGQYANVINIPQSSQSWAYTEEGIEPHEFDMEKAKQLLDEAGWAPGADGIREKDGKKFEIHFSATADNPVIDALIPVMTQNYQELGIKLTAETLDFNAIMDKKDKGEFEMFFAAWGLTPDPDSTVYITDGNQNDIGYSNPAYDAAMKKGLNAFDLEERKAAYAEAYRILNADVPDLPIYQRRDAWTINSRLNGIDITPYKTFAIDLYKAEIEQ
ncbi:ABC transporter substrate-binding protein [Paenibacillus glucanolyticus]|uniref:ABC transporter substrate-binding protein n=1 Tax=Paenibacillus TaxID=44249 RepID=UPI00096C26A2|nr:MULTISPECIES: ABC transporter substrate-binding protein [Paenibacillus]AWP30349.1 ABC transporter substrate-binding protein [Paenibacillus sp. Cedars]MPY19366.1 ABC transporter substrate-binding protein [Paenibacillus glucanolyticus]OMF79380.1 ABC transporter substrate-binding protein [Paenibacillus glucanolyticus]